MSGAVVLGGDYQALAIVRSLGRRGIPVFVLDDEPSVARHSRYAGRAARFTALRSCDRLASDLIDAARRHGLRGWVLYPTRDELVEALARDREALCEWFRVPTAPLDVVRWALDKRLTYDLAGRLGIPAPWTAGLAEIGSRIAGGSISWPLLVKPAIKSRFIAKARVKGWIVRDIGELRSAGARAAEIVPADEVLIQEFIEGGGASQYAFCGLFECGRPLATMTVRRRRQWPSDLGRSSSYVETIEQPDIESSSRSLLSSIAYDGLAELEYKFDKREGVFKLLDFNARSWGYHGLGGAAGVDFPLLLHRWATGQPVEPARARAGVAWVRLSTDVPVALQELRAGRLSLRAYLAQLRRVATEAVVSRDDLRPAAAELALLPYLYGTRRVTRKAIA